MIRKIVLAILAPALLILLFKFWQLLTLFDFRFFAALPVVFVLAILLSLILKKKTGQNYVPLLIFYFIVSAVVLLCISPSPLNIWNTYATMSKTNDSIFLKDIENHTSTDLILLKDAYPLTNAKLIRTYGYKGDYNGARGIVPVISFPHTNDVPVKVYAAFTTYVRDKGNASWFILDRDEDYFAQEWNEKILSARIVRDTSKLKMYQELMLSCNRMHNLRADSNPIFVESGYPYQGFNYVCTKIFWIGLILLSLGMLINLKIAINTKKNDTLQFSEVSKDKNHL